MCFRDPKHFPDYYELCDDVIFFAPIFTYLVVTRKIMVTSVSYLFQSIFIIQILKQVSICKCINHNFSITNE